MNAHTLASIGTTAPLVSFAIALIGFRNRHSIAAALVIAAGLVSVVCSGLLVLVVDEPVLVTSRWLTSGSTEIAFGFLLDGPSVLMGLVVAVVALCIEIYSLGYMAEDPARGRFFAFLGLFSWSMLSFVYAASLLQTFIFWELVGLASFLLIGFWHHKPSAVAAAKKAFVMTRIGDVGIFIGLAILLQASGTLDIATINMPGTIAELGPERTELITLLLLMGIVGKSAQFPLHTWLPDAMEGPTPVSALLHSATMVAAGVFLFARFHPLFVAAPTTLTVALWLGCITAILASTMALTAMDIKKVLAFSSMSQLGYMIMGLAAVSQPEHAGAALFAGMFHLITHAVFKALLFLTAGAYIHQYGTNDLVAIGRAGGRSMRATTAGLVLGGLALAGVPPLAGFFSKEAILHQLGVGGGLVFAVGAYLAAFLTAYYTGRMICLILFLNPDGELRPEEPAATAHGAHHGPAEPWVIKGPILLLTVGAVVVGFFGVAIAGKLGVTHESPAVGGVAVALGVVAAGLGLSWLDFGRKGARQRGFMAHLPRLERLTRARWHIDTIYRHTFGLITNAVAKLSRTIEDRFFDDGGEHLAKGSLRLGGLAARLQTGNVQAYVAVATVLIALAAWLVGGGL